MRERIHHAGTRRLLLLNDHILVIETRAQHPAKATKAATAFMVGSLDPPREECSLHQDVASGTANWKFL